MIDNLYLLIITDCFRIKISKFSTNENILFTIENSPLTIWVTDVFYDKNHNLIRYLFLNKIIDYAIHFIYKTKVRFKKKG